MPGGCAVVQLLLRSVSALADAMEEEIDKPVLGNVTGGASGIGRGVAIEFAREGATVVVADIREAPLRGKYHERDVKTPTVEEIEKLGATGTFIRTDVADDSQLERLIQKTVEQFGGLDILHRT